MQGEYHSADARASRSRPSQLVKSAGQADARAFAPGGESHRQAGIERMPNGGPKQPQSHDK
jgi:hypothetical protein